MQPKKVAVIDNKIIVQYRTCDLMIALANRLFNPIKPTRRNDRKVKLRGDHWKP
jgi:hypothetical protein